MLIFCLLFIFIKSKPHRRGDVKKYRKVIEELRNFGRTHIVQRLKEMENSEFVPNDILSIIINSASKLLF